MKSPNGRARRGVSLIELILIMGAMTLVLTTCAVYTHMLLRLERSGRESASDMTTTARLARQFRTDVRAASAARKGPGETLVLSSEGGGEVAYSVETGTLVRVEKQAGKTRREGYAYALHAPPRFESDGKLVRFTVTESPTNRPDSLRPDLVVEAVLGKDGSPLGAVAMRRSQQFKAGRRVDRHPGPRPPGSGASDRRGDGPGRRPVGSRSGPRSCGCRPRRAGRVGLRSCLGPPDRRPEI
ncbi:MAG: hypothetical protein U0835_18910 [Isosphaeraceae bacterium]